MTTPIYLKRDFYLAFSRDASARYDVLAQKDLRETFQLDHEEGHGWGPGIIAGSAEITVDLGPLTTVREIIVVTDGEITLKLNVAEHELTVQPPKVPSGATAKSGLLYADTEFTQLKILNVETSDTNVLVHMIGD